MKLEFSVEKTIKSRCSVRTYTNEDISSEKVEQIKNYIKTLSNPFSVTINFTLLQTDKLEDTEKLGTYGVIKGSNHYIGATVKKGELALEALGYEFEKLVLYLISIGLGTCWLGGTFNRSSFANALEVNQEELFPIISPVGYAADKKRFTDSLVRRIAKSDQRKPWSELFYHQEFNTTLNKEEAGPYEPVLKMVRLAPSASNKQPWRILKEGTTYHFYEAQTKGYSDRFPYDIQAIDIGIATCHFHLAALEKDLPGQFQTLKTPPITTPENYRYVFSWITEN